MDTEGFSASTNEDVKKLAKKLISDNQCGFVTSIIEGLKQQLKGRSDVKELDEKDLLDGSEIAALFETIISGSGDDLRHIYGLLALMQTVRVYAESDNPEMVTDILYEPETALFDRSSHHNRLMEPLINRMAKFYKHTDFSDSGDAWKKLLADVEDVKKAIH